jgi:hypothetical protein
MYWPYSPANGQAGAAKTQLQKGERHAHCILRRGLVALFAAAVSFGAITQAQAETLRIGYQKYGTLVLLKAKGTLEKRLAAQGVDVQWTEFPGGPQLLEGLNVGSIDFGVTGETRPCSLRRRALICSTSPTNRQRLTAKRSWCRRTRRSNRWRTSRARKSS